MFIYATSLLTTKIAMLNTKMMLEKSLLHFGLELRKIVNFKHNDLLKYQFITKTD